MKSINPQFVRVRLANPDGLDMRINLAAVKEKDIAEMQSGLLRIRIGGQVVDIVESKDDLVHALRSFQKWKETNKQ